MDIELIRAVANGTEGRRRAWLRRVDELPPRPAESGRGRNNGASWSAHHAPPSAITTWTEPNGSRVSRIVRQNGSVFTCACEPSGNVLIYEGEHRTRWDEKAALLVTILALTDPGADLGG